MPTTYSVAVTVPLPTWHAVVGVALFKQAPPSMPALASRPAGSSRDRSLVVSPLDGLNLMAVPRLAVEPAVAELGVRVTAGVPIDADAAAGASATVAPTAARASRIGRLIVTSS